MSYLIYIILGYLSGSVLYSYLLPKYLCRVDVRKSSEDGNPGAFNAFTCGGFAVGCLSICCDIAKGLLPVWLACRSVSMDNLLFALILIAPVAGHAWPLFQPSKGGKAIAVSFGSLLGLLPDLKPALLLAACYLVFSLIFIIRPHRKRSIVTFACFGIGCLLLPEYAAVKSGCLGIAAIVCHRHYISR